MDHANIRSDAFNAFCRLICPGGFGRRKDAYNWLAGEMGCRVKFFKTDIETVTKARALIYSKLNEWKQRAEKRPQPVDSRELSEADLQTWARE